MVENWPVLLGVLMGATLVYATNSVIDLINARIESSAEMNKLKRHITEQEASLMILRRRIDTLEATISAKQ